jgi:dienelactone hydrolase
MRPVQEKYGEELRGQGYAVVAVDFVAARGLSTMCGKVAQYFEEMSARHMRDTLAFLKTQPFVNQAAIGAVGWSTGGGLIIQALRAESSLQASVMLYPICRGLKPWRGSAPALMLLGSLDDVNPPNYCHDLARDVRAGLEVKTYEGARHSFDDSSLKSVVPFLGTMTAGYHREAATQAWAEIKQFLNVHLKK